jgi:ribosome-binding ATPase YchF (GTP1/OBG family)
MFGQAVKLPLKETSAFHPRSPYGCAKVYAYWVTRNYRESYGMFASNGILFNHESPRRGETSVTRKITRGLARIKLGKEQKIYLEDIGLKQSGLDELITKAYTTLGLLTFLTTGEDETRAWTAHIGDLIPRASRAIHTDFEKKFIRADVINWKELLEIGGGPDAKVGGAWSKAREAGKLKLVGKDYVIQEGDVVEIKI